MTTNDNMIYLGAYRVQVNRGGGILHAFYAKNCEYLNNATTSSNNIILNDQDYEKQNIKLLTKNELLDIILKKQEIGEAQWLATISTALLYDDYI